MPWLCNK